MAKESLYGLKADLKACRSEVDGLMQQVSLLRGEHERNILAARVDEHRKIASLASIIEALSQLVKDAYDRRTE